MRIRNKSIVVKNKEVSNTLTDNKNISFEFTITWVKTFYKKDLSHFMKFRMSVSSNSSMLLLGNLSKK